MSYGQRGFHQWTLDEEESQPFFRQAVELGITFWDTANGYGGGTSEEFVGRAMRKIARREDIVSPPRSTTRCTTDPADQGCPAKPSWSSSTHRWPGSARTTSTSTTSTGSTPTSRSRRP